MPVPRRRRPVRTTLGTGLAATLLVAAALVAAVFTSAAPAAAASTPPRGDVIANLFEWNWNSVASECTNVLGPNGYGAVQVAPPQESVTLAGSGHPWWEVYQPVSYQVSSRMGNRTAFAAMVTACHNAGVKVYADAVLNHMTGQTGSSGYAGTTFTGKYTYPGMYGSQDFHHYPGDCPNSDGQIHDYNNATDVQKCELVQLSDLRTESSYVRGKLAGYLNDLLSLGVDGFRLDAAKHIDAADIAAIKAQLTQSGVPLPGGHARRRGEPARLRDQRQRAGVHLRQEAQGAVPGQHRQPADLRPELGHGAEQQVGDLRRQPRHRPGRLHPELQERLDLPAGQHLLPRLGLRHAAGLCQLHLQHTTTSRRRRTEEASSPPPTAAAPAPGCARTGSRPSSAWSAGTTRSPATRWPTGGATATTSSPSAAARPASSRSTTPTPR